MIVLDTSVLVDALCGDMDSEPALRTALSSGRQLLLPSLVLYEWLRGPRVPRELAIQEALLPSEGQSARLRPVGWLLPLSSPKFPLVPGPNWAFLADPREP